MRYLDSNSRGTVYTHRIVHVSPYKNWRLAPVGDGFNIINIRSGKRVDLFKDLKKNLI